MKRREDEIRLGNFELILKGITIAVSFFKAISDGPKKRDYKKRD